VSQVGIVFLQANDWFDRTCNEAAGRNELAVKQTLKFIQNLFIGQRLCKICSKNNQSGWNWRSRISLSPKKNGPMQSDELGGEFNFEIGL
jgi:hypothetical protein